MKQKTEEKKQQTEKIKREIIKVTNPDYFLQEIGPMIYNFVIKLNIPGISYESLMSYYMYTHGIETHVALVDNKPKGFIGIGIIGPPYYSTAIIHSIYKPEKDLELAEMMYDTIIDFMKKHKLIYYYYIVINKKLGEHFAKKAKERNLTVSCCGYYYSGKRIFKR